MMIDREKLIKLSKELLDPETELMEIACADLKGVDFADEKEIGLAVAMWVNGYKKCQEASRLTQPQQGKTAEEALKSIPNIKQYRWYNEILEAMHTFAGHGREVRKEEIEEFRMAVTGILFVKFGGRVDLPEIVETIAQMLPNNFGKGERTQVTKEMR